MGQKVTAAEAAQLVHVSERTMRTWLKAWIEAEKVTKEQAEKIHTPGQPVSWAIDVDTLATLTGRKIDAEALARINASRPTAARLELLEREIASLRTRIRILEGQISRQARPSDNLTVERGTDTLPATPPATYMPESPLSAFHVTSPAPVSAYTPSPPPLRMRHTSMGDTGAFDNRAVAARWLVTHGVNSEGTPKSWPGWRELDGPDLTPTRVLTLAIGLREEADREHNHRVTWRLHTCSDMACICHELLGA